MVRAQGRRAGVPRDRPGAHVQVREFRDRWTVELDSFNPHYRPVRHVLLDTGPYSRAALSHPLRTTADVLLYGPIRGVQFGAQVAAVGTSTIGRLLGPVVNPSRTGEDG